MIDKDYIEELRALSDKKEAKAKLFEYAEQFGISVKKSKSFDNIVIDIEEALNALADEPLPETDGLSITDLITAADDVDGVNFTNEEVKEEAILLFDSPTEQRRGLANSASWHPVALLPRRAATAGGRTRTYRFV